MRVFKEKRMYSTALQCFKKGIKIIQDELKQTNGDNELKVKLTVSKARYNVVESTMDVSDYIWFHSDITIMRALCFTKSKNI